MKNIKLLILIISLIFSIITSNDSNTGESNLDSLNNQNQTNNSEIEHLEDMDDFGATLIMKELGLENNEFLTHDDMRKVYEKIFFHKDVNTEERDYYENIIVEILKDIPQKIERNESKKYFYIEFLLKFIKISEGKGFSEELNEEETDHHVDSDIKDEI